MLKLQLGKKYVRKDGEITGPLAENKNGRSDGPYPFRDPKTCYLYTPKGNYHKNGQSSSADLVYEYVEEPKAEEPKKLQLNLQLGKKYVRKDGEVTEPLVKNMHEPSSDTYPFYDPRSCLSYTPLGAIFLEESSSEDIVKEYIEEPKPQKSLSFWQARDEALNGKKVKMVDSKVVFEKLDFQKALISWTNQEIRASWEVVKEFTACYVAVDSNGTGKVYKQRDEAFAHPNAKFCYKIEFGPDDSHVLAEVHVL